MEKKETIFNINEFDKNNINDVLQFREDVLAQESMKLPKGKERSHSVHKCKHPNGQINIGTYDPKTDILEIMFDVSNANPYGKAKLKMIVHN